MVPGPTPRDLFGTINGSLGSPRYSTVLQPVFKLPRRRSITPVGPGREPLPPRERTIEPRHTQCRRRLGLTASPAAQCWDWGLARDWVLECRPTTGTGTEPGPNDLLMTTSRGEVDSKSSCPGRKRLHYACKYVYNKYIRSYTANYHSLATLDLFLACRDWPGTGTGRQSGDPASGLGTD